MIGWQRTTLGRESTKPQYGAVASGTDRPEAGPLFVRQTDLVDGRINWNSVPYCEIDQASAGRFLLRTGDVLVSRLGASVGRAARVRETNGAVFAGYLVRFRIRDDSRVDPRYLGYLLMSPEWEGHVRSVQSGAAQPTLNAKQMSAFEFELPPLSEQRGIADVLEALDDKIDLNQRLAESADELATAEFMSALMQGEETEALSTVAVVTMGTSPPGSSYNEVGDGLPFYQGTRDFGFRFPSRRVYCTEPKRLAGVGDVLVSVRAPVGRLNVAVERCVIGRGLAAVMSDYPSCLHHGLRASSDAWEPYELEGTVFGSINGKALKSIPLRWPTTEIDALESVLAPLDALVVQLLQENERLSELRDTLLPELLSGELRVGDIEDDLEEAGV